MRLLPILLLLASPLSAATLSGVSAGQPDAWFAATFDGPVTLTVTDQLSGGECGNPQGSEDCWFWILEDSDNSGFLWIDDLDNGVWDCDPTSVWGRGITLVGVDKTYTDYFDVQLVDVGGSHGMVLYQQKVKRDLDVAAGSGWTSRLERICRAQTATQDNGYMAFDLYLQSDMATQNCDDGVCFLIVTEWSELGSSSGRMALSLERNTFGTDVWEWQLAFWEDYPTAENLLWAERVTSPLPSFGTWMRVEWEWVQHTTSGTAKVWVDDVLIVDKSGQTKDVNSVRELDWLVLYSDSRMDDDSILSPTWTYRDNFIICGSRAECG